MQRTSVQVGRGYASSLAPATLGRVQLPFVHQRCATQRTRQRVPDLTCGNRVVHWGQQDPIVGHYVGKECRRTKPLQACSAGQCRAGENRPGWIESGSGSVVDHRGAVVPNGACEREHSVTGRVAAVTNHGSHRKHSLAVIRLTVHKQCGERPSPASCEPLATALFR